MAEQNTPEEKNRKTRALTATQFFLKGVAISLPPILTLVILLWIGRGINDYIISPISTVVRFGFAKLIDDSLPTKSDRLTSLPDLPALPYCDHNYRLTTEERDRLERLLRLEPPPPLTPKEIDFDQVYVPIGNRSRSVNYRDFALAAGQLRDSEMPKTATGLYMAVVTLRQPLGLFGLSAVAVSISVLILYYLGRIGTARVGAWTVQKVETTFLAKLPVISSVYSSVKQVTDFLFSERTIDYNRVVAVEYPRRGIWSLGFVTGESILEITAAAGEPLLSVLVPTSPMPVTGYTINVPRSEVLDLNMTIDQAFQFCISCGVHVPPQQRVTAELLRQELAKRLEVLDQSSVRRPPANQLRQPFPQSFMAPERETDSQARPSEDAPIPSSDAPSDSSSSTPQDEPQPPCPKPEADDEASEQETP